MRILALLLTAGLVITGCVASPPDQGGPVSVSVSSCGAGWTDPAAGPQHIRLHNTDSRAGEAQLIDARTHAVFADVEPIGPGTTADVDVDLGAGRYAWRCLMEDEASVDGPTVVLRGSATGTTPGVQPVDQADLVAPTKAYEHYVSGALPRLAQQIGRLRGDIADPARAKRDWLTAHLEYERLGAAYDAFGALDAAINGLPNGLPGGIHDPHWTGFHRIEYGLWHEASTATLRAETTQLDKSVSRLSDQFASTQIDPTQIAIRAHEIAENALQFELTGRTDFGSHSELHTVRANLDGTSVVLSLVHDLLAPRYPQLAETERQLHLSESDLDARASHERIDADISQLCELLAPVASILEPRKVQ